MEYLVAMVAVILCIVVPLYAKDGYYQIGNAKFAAYKTVMTGGSILLIVAVMPYLFFRCKEHRKVCHGPVRSCLRASYRNFRNLRRVL